MKKNKTSIEKIKMPFLVLFFLLSCAMFFLVVTYVYGNRGQWVHFCITLASYIIFCIWFATACVCYKLDDKFKKLEEFLDKRE